MATRLILLIVLSICSATSAFAQSDQELVDRYDRFLASERYEQALRCAQEICERYPDAAWWRFKLGEMHAKTGDADAAIEALGVSLDNGFTGVSSFKESELLDPVRSDPRFDGLLERVKAAAQDRLDDYERKAKRHRPETHIPDRLELGDTSKPGLILALHGTGMDGKSMIGALREVADTTGLVLIAPDALREAGDGYSWTYRDESALMVRHMIERAEQEHGIDTDRVYLVGFSQGANIALTMLQTDPDRFAGVLPICGHYEQGLAKPEEGAALPPVVLMTGAGDRWKGTYANAKRDFAAAGADVKVKVIPGMGHQLPTSERGIAELIKAIRWFESLRTEEP